MSLFWLCFTLVLIFVAGYFVGKKKSEASRSDSGPSASSDSVVGNNYYVFLSFRGPDTRNGLVDHLYHRLRDVGLSFHPNFVFRDDNDLSFGEDIDENLMNAINCSKVSIPIISENYAASEWCLRELIQIMKCVERGEQKVLPVLYKVKPYEVRELEGAFGEAFNSRVERFKEDVQQQGPEALRKALASRVFESDKFAGGREGDLIHELIKIITDQLHHDFPPSLAADLVGFDENVAKVTRWVDTGSSKIQTTVICGISGIGKTTLATFIYKKLFYNFECRSFLKHTRETIESKGMEHVQSLLISDITKTPAGTVRDSEIGINKIRICCKKKKVLILLDDVDCQDHLDKLIGGCDFGLGSKIIITCRDKAILESEYCDPKKKENSECLPYYLETMNRKDSLLLFNSYAFGETKPQGEFVALSSDIVDTTGGLPLALVTVGSLLKDKDKSIWMETLEKLRKVPNKDVQKIMRITYDSLGYEEQQIFLDIACFFIGVDHRIATYLWDDLNFFPSIGLNGLINSSSITVDDNNKLTMHDQLRDLGRAIARPAHKKPWDCCRLWGEEAMKVQRSKEENRNIEALHLDKNGSSMFMERESFKRMPHLKFLRLSDVDFVANFEDSLSELRWLQWEMRPDSFEVTNIDLENLLIFDISGGNIRDDWGGWSSIKMERLKVLNLSWCSNLTSTPDLSAFKNLEMLILENCENLGILDPSIGDVKRLVSLNLRRCGSLKELPAELGELKELEELVVDETDIQEIPECIESLEKLKTLSAVGCCLLTRVPSSISGLVSLLSLNLSTCKKLRALPDSLVALGKLERLSLARCYLLEQIPTSIGKLGKLVELDLSSTGIKELPPSIGELNKLEILRISHSEIEKLPIAVGKLKSLQELQASGCHNLKGEILLDKGGLSSLIRAKISRLLGSSDELPTLELHELSNLQHLDLLYCTGLQSLPKPPPSLSSLRLTCQSPALPSLSHLSLLKELNLHSCMSLESIPELPSCIRKLRVCKCPKLERLSIPPEWKSLLELELLQCYGLKELKGLEALDSLRKLDVSISTELSNLNNFEDLESWRFLDQQSYDDEKADNLPEMRGLEKLASLEVLNISERALIKRLELSKSEHLEQLIVNNCHMLIEIRFHDEIKSLKRFERDGCQQQITTLLSS